MKRLIVSFAVILMSFLFTGCSNYNFFKAVYQGVQTRDQMQTTPAERAGKPEPMNYEQYDSERKR